MKLKKNHTVKMHHIYNSNESPYSENDNEVSLFDSNHDCVKECIIVEFNQYESQLLQINIHIEYLSYF